MELKDFISRTLVELNEAIDDARARSSRDIHFGNSESSRTVEFDIAVSAEHKTEAAGKAGIKVLEFLEGGGSLSKETANSTVSRIKFGVNIEHRTKEEDAVFDAQIRARNNGHRIGGDF